MEEKRVPPLGGNLRLKKLLEGSKGWAKRKPSKCQQGVRRIRQRNPKRGADQRRARRCRRVLGQFGGKVPPNGERGPLLGTQKAPTQPGGKMLK